MSKITGLTALILIIVAVITIYRAIYQGRINRQLADGNIRRRKLPSPWAFSIITIFIALIAIAGISAFFAKNNPPASFPEDYINAVYDYKTYNPDEMTYYRSLYSTEDNPGYSKYIEQKGAVRFTYFLRDDAFDYYHPSFIIFVEYTGDKNILHYGVQGIFRTTDGALISGFGHAGSDFEGYFCIIGTATVQCIFELTAYLYDNSLKGEDMGDYAAASETLTVLAPAP